MKLSGFLVGGIIGAAATMYVSRKRPGAVSWAASALSDVSKSVARKSVSKMMGKSIVNEASNAAPKHSDDTAVKSEAAWGQIEAIVNSDPEVKREADKIKAESSVLAH
ncbi:hypothetical protein BK133_10770 [Paenibacillus sp. FSL H8-0548]|uniref:hypothetical protein n=1 Tax=Paenibacillus sp. FSL H8-0548 TaxID=1920422 RepID=UPI00096D89D2|nr:hypothetical protein [Paenibacillus sp. FSL H8-0548]OMF35189.1 hypothetical protein BK133_10770 [Paenibacillus sp. FSL H8-0548]